MFHRIIKFTLGDFSIMAKSKVRSLKSKVRSLMTHNEYKANKSGMNIFFGAIIGVVMADVQGLAAHEYALVLLMTASFVVILLYISASKHRIIYALYALGILCFTWWLAFQDTQMLNLDVHWLRNRLLPALSVWWFMITCIEFMPRGDRENNENKK